MAKYEVSIDGQQYSVEIIRDDGRLALLKVDDQEYEVEAINVSAAPASGASPAEGAPRTASAASSSPQGAVGAGGLEVRAPMPGLVLQVMATVGQHVKDGDALIRLEAMKMENDIQSHAEGTVKEIRVAQGDEVQEGEVLLVLGE
jgi:biotin carboxyl carrier protein